MIPFISLRESHGAIWCLAHHDLKIEAKCPGCVSFQDILKEQGYKGYNNGESISREFFDKNITGGHNSILSNFLWPERTQAEQDKFSDEKEARFRELSGACCRSCNVCICQVAVLCM